MSRPCALLRLLLATGAFHALLLLATAPLAAAGTGQAAGAPPAPSWNIQILFSNDLHGKTEPCG